METTAQREKAVSEARALLIELDNVRKTFKCHKEHSPFDVNPMFDLKFAQDGIVKKLEELRKQANLSQEDFERLVYEGVVFSQENPIDEKTGKVKSCYINQHKHIKDECISNCE